MDINQLANTFLLLNLRENDINYFNVVMIMTIVYLFKYYSLVYEYFIDYFNKRLYKKCDINLELKLDFRNSNPAVNSFKLLGIIYHINRLKLPITRYEEVKVDFELKDDEETYQQVNNSHLIPMLSNQRIKDDIYVSISINKETKNVEKGSTRRRRFDDDDLNEKRSSEEIKTIYANICCYKHHIDYVKEFVDKCESEYLEFYNRNNNKQYIFTTKKSWDPDTDNFIVLFTSYNFSSFKSFNNLFFEDKAKIIKRIDNYSNNIERYKQLGIAHTLGFLFHGLPGTGKTSTIKAIANYTNRSLISINMKDITNISSLYRLFSTEYMSGMKIKCKKRIYVFEEIDCYDCFLSRELEKEKREENKTDLVDVLSTVMTKSERRDKKMEDELKEKITLGQILEVLDGIIENDDRICIFTTNHIERIDKALLRPGRIDLVVEFKNLRKYDINNLYRLWYGEPISNKDLENIKDYVISQAEFGKLCFENMENPKKVIKELQKL
jgi:hypothetical protein